MVMHMCAHPQTYALDLTDILGQVIFLIERLSSIMHRLVLRKMSFIKRCPFSKCPLLEVGGRGHLPQIPH